VEGKKLFSTPLADGPFDAIQVFELPKGKVLLGLTSSASSQVLLFDTAGALQKGFPLYGAVPFAIGDMNRDGYLNLITASREGYVYAYAIEQ
jgi:hypothetical protein